MSIENVRKYFSNPHSVTPRHLKISSDNLSSVSASANLSPLKHSSLHVRYEEGAIAEDFLGFNQTPSLIVRRPPSPPFIHSTEPLCFSSPYEVESKNEF